MQIVKQTPSELILRNQPSNVRKGIVILWAVLFSGIPLAMMGAWIYGLGVTQLSCQRESSQVVCDRTQSRLLGALPGPVETFDQVTVAELKTSAATERSVTVVDNWVALQTANGEVAYVEEPMRINGRKGTANEMQAITDQINQFLASEQTTLTLERDLRFRLGNSLFPLLFMGMFVVIGGAVVYVSFRSEELVFDATTQQFHSSCRTLLGTKNWQCALSDLEDVAMDVRTDSHGDAIYALKFIPQPSQPIFMSGSKADVEETCGLIRAFLQGQEPTAPPKKHKKLHASLDVQQQMKDYSASTVSLPTGPDYGAA
ncbi:hypothetical protein [Leptothoe kymatousa]|uniref:Uncharacterized protein n=1 Tax=Leptothoe kymatousa TAU-MAC 1615 TaxID=2364775 RepID=A0ABS5Y0D3_9CYAN|nr:hypothetical protein [Leptothoe kymatousa]MBT9311265.1 hypothetical protein [Leptothoe kymatousa TAU-MAC 1615]